MREIKDTCKKDQGFTLIELIMVIVVLSILASTAALKYFSIKPDASDEQGVGRRANRTGEADILHSERWIAEREGLLPALGCRQLDPQRESSLHEMVNARHTDLGSAL